MAAKKKTQAKPPAKKATPAKKGKTATTKKNTKEAAKKTTTKKKTSKVVKKSAPKEKTQKKTAKKVKKENAAVSFLKAKQIQLVAGLALIAAVWVLFMPQRSTGISYFETWRLSAGESIKMQLGRK